MNDVPRTGDALALLEGLRAGDDETRRGFFRAFYKAPYRRARSILRNDGDAHDVTCAVLVDFLDRRAAEFRGTTCAAVQLYLIVAAIDRARRLQSRRKVVRLDARAVQNATEGAEAGGRDPWLLARLERCLARLSPKLRQLLTLKYAEDLDNTEIASLTGVSRAAISQRLTHPRRGALGRLRRCMAASASTRGTSGATT